MSGKDDQFSFRLGRLPSGEGLRALTKEEAEQWLLQMLEEKGGKDAAVLEQLLNFYLQVQEPTKAEECIETLLEVTSGSAARETLLFKLGQVMELQGNFTRAVDFYRDCHALKPPHPETWYFVNNNLGYSLNVLGRFDEAEPFLKAAIGIDPTRSNAYKNLGLCYQGCGRLADAAEQFIAATKADAADPRSVKHLEELINAHPEIYTLMPGLKVDLANCRAAVAKVGSMAPDFKSFWRRLRQRYGNRLQ